MLQLSSETQSLLLVPFRDNRYQRVFVKHIVFFFPQIFTLHCLFLAFIPLIPLTFFCIMKIGISPLLVVRLCKYS